MNYYIDMREYKELMRVIDCVTEDQLEHLKEESSYNHNFYYFKYKSTTYKLLGESDDIDTTAWYWVRGDALLLLGQSGVKGVIHVLEYL